MYRYLFILIIFPRSWLPAALYLTLTRENHFSQHMSVCLVHVGWKYTLADCDSHLFFLLFIGVSRTYVVVMCLLVILAYLLCAAPFLVPLYFQSQLDSWIYCLVTSLTCRRADGAGSRTEQGAKKGLLGPRLPIAERKLRSIFVFHRAS